MGHYVGSLAKWKDYCCCQPYYYVVVDLDEIQVLPFLEIAALMESEDGESVEPFAVVDESVAVVVMLSTLEGV